MEQPVFPASPGSLPEGSKPPAFLTNPYFTGRDADLKLLSALLVDAPQPRPVVLTGVGGSGKSQLAGEFLYRYAGQFATVHWLNAAQPALIEGELAACGRAMHIQPWPEQQPEQVEAVLRAWRNDPRRLVVFDNLEEPQTLRGWLPRLGGVRVLVTARQTKWRADLGATLHKVEPLKPEPGRELLRALAPRLQVVPDAELDLVTKRLGGLPLALDVAGRHFDLRDSLTPQVFLQELDQQGGVARALAFTLQGKDTPTQHAADLLATFLSSWDLLAPLDTVDGLARRILRCAGWCAPNTPIPPGVLEGAVEALGEGEALAPDQQAAAFEMALARLYGLGLLERGAGGPSIHPLLADFARVVEGLASCGPSVAETLVRLGDAANNSGLYINYLPLLPHVEQGVRREAQLPPEQAAGLWNSLGRYYRDIAAYARARTALERALAIGEQELPPEKPFLGTLHNNLGMLLHDLGELPKAREYYERALAIGEQALPPDHPIISILHINLGLLLRDLGELPEARAHLEQALAIGEQALPPEHPDLATSHTSLGLLLHEMGALSEAQEHYERALAINEQALSPEHPALGTLHGNLGTLLLDLGALPEAREHLERALAISKLLPPGHPELAIAYNNLGALLFKLGALPEAREFYECALAIGKEVLPSGHTDLGVWHSNLGTLLHAMGELPAARAHLEQALDIITAALPENHSHIQKVRKNLDRLKRQMGDDSVANGI